MSTTLNNRPAVYVVDGEVSKHKPRDVFGADAAILDARRLLVRTVVDRFSSHRALWGWDLSNELNLVQMPETEAGERWLQILTGDIHAIDPDHPVTAAILVSEGASGAYS